MAKQFTIVRDKWLRGATESPYEDPNTVLLNAVGGRCCLGFFLQACGCSDEQLLGHATPNNVGATHILPIDARWLCAAGSDTQACSLLMEANDSSELTEEQREETVTELFKERDIEVLFIDTEPTT